MKKILSILLCAGIIMTYPSFAYASDVQGITYYVAQDGNDSGAGSMTNPFKTLTGARDAIRQLKKNGALTAPVTVYIREGEYVSDSAFELFEQDSGTPECPITYSAYNDENVVISGAVPLTSADFSKVSDMEVLNKLDAAVRDKVVCADLAALGISEYGAVLRTEEVSGCELFAGGEALLLSRWPNQGYAYTGTIKSNKPLSFKSNTARALKWTENDAYVVGMWGYDWSVEAMKIASVSEDHTVTANSASTYTPALGQRYYAHNILAELDMPGEYYIDRAGGKLYYYPKENGFDDLKISVLKDSMIKGVNLSYVNFDGLKIMYGQKDGMEFSGYTGGRIKNCAVENVGRKGINITNGTSDIISECRVSDTGLQGICLAGGNVQDLSFGNNLITKCNIFKCSRLSDVMIAAVNIVGVGNTIEYSKIHDVPQQAIVFKGNEHKIQHNEIYNACCNSSDCGAVNAGLSWVERGTEIMYNYFHDIYDVYGTSGNAIYLDDMLSGTRVYGNIFYHCGNAVFIHGGRDNTVRDNTIYDCLNSISVLTLSHINNPSYTDRTNGIYFRNLLSVPFNKEPYKTYYPELIKIVSDPEPFYPKNNIVSKNNIINSAKIVLSEEAREFSRVFDNNYSQRALYTVR